MASRAFAGLRSAKSVVLVERWWALRASEPIASCGRKRAVVRMDAAELRAAPWCEL